MLIDGRPIAVGNGIARNGFIADRVPTLCGVRQYGKGIWGGSGGGSGRALGACSGGVLWGRATRALAVLQQVRPHAHWRPRPRASGAPRGTPGGPARRGAARAALSRRTAPRHRNSSSGSQGFWPPQLVAIKHQPSAINQPSSRRLEEEEIVRNPTRALFLHMSSPPHFLASTDDRAAASRRQG